MSNNKFRALVHYIIDQCQDNPGSLGAVRLNKVLWFVDVFAFRETGVSVTGATYKKRERGPVPANILATLQDLVESGDIVVREPEFKYDTRKFVSLQQPSSDLLSHDERVLAEGVLAAVRGMSATEISDISHDQIWEAAAEGEVLPLEATLTSDQGEVSDDVRRWAESIISEIDTEAA